MDIRAKVIEKYTVYVVDIDELKSQELFRFNQSVSVLGECDEESQEYKNIKERYDSGIAELEQMARFSESEMPKAGEFDSLIPYYEEKDGVVLQKWEIRKNDVYLISQRIEEMKSHLSNDDYKIIKCYEANLLNNPLPYDIVELHSEREKIRKEINELEKLLL